MEFNQPGERTTARSRDVGGSQAPAVEALDELRSASVRDVTNWSVDAVRERLRVYRSSLNAPSVQVVLAVGLLFVFALGVATALVRSWSVPGRRSAQEIPSTTTPTVSPTTLAPTVIAVGGAVRTPGVYRLATGSRVVDALEAAGGPTDDIDLDRINLAAPVVDGERVWISRRNEPEPVDVPGPHVSSGDVQGLGTPLDLNTATLQQLDALPGVGPATAKAIIDRRSQVGRFRSVDDLLSVKGIGSAKLDALRESVTIR